MISSAHVSALAGFAGRHENTIRRLGDSETPVAVEPWLFEPWLLSGPTTVSSMMCGGAVVPALLLPLAARDQSCGRIRSSYGPSFRRTKATDTRCCPALTRTGSVRR